MMSILPLFLIVIHIYVVQYFTCYQYITEEREINFEQCSKVKLIK